MVLLHRSFYLQIRPFTLNLFYMQGIYNVAAIFIMHLKKQIHLHVVLIKEKIVYTAPMCPYGYTYMCTV